MNVGVHHARAIIGTITIASSARLRMHGGVSVKPVTAGTDRLTRSQEPPQKGLHADSLTTADVPSAVTLAEGDAAGTAGCGCGWTCAVAVPAMVMASAEAPQIAVLRLIMSFLP